MSKCMVCEVSGNDVERDGALVCEKCCEVSEVAGCSTCPFAYLDDDCLPTCNLLCETGIGADQSEPYKRVQYALRDDAPPECPLRAGPRLVTLRVT